MFADRDSGAEQDRVHRSSAHTRIVDIVTVDPDERRPFGSEPFGGRQGQE